MRTDWLCTRMLRCTGDECSVRRNHILTRLLSTLLPGSGESGKSTIVKQMKIIHQNGYNKEELMLYRLTVIKNLVDSAQAIVLASRKFQLEPEILDNRVSVPTCTCGCRISSLDPHVCGMRYAVCGPLTVYFVRCLFRCRPARSGQRGCDSAISCRRGSGHLIRSCHCESDRKSVA